MDRNIQVLHQRNRLLMKTLWVIVLMGILFAIKKPAVLYIDIAAGIPLCIAVTFLTVRRLFINKMPYINIAALMLFNVGSFFAEHSTGPFFNILIVIAILAFYHDFKVIVTSTIIGIAIQSTFYALNSSTWYKDIPPLDIPLIIQVTLMVAVILAIQTRIGHRLRIEVEHERQEAVQAKKQVEKLLEEIVASVQNLRNISEVVTKNVVSAGQISKEVTVTFGEIAQGIASQASSVGDINESMKTMDHSIQVVSERSVAMRELSQSTVEVTEQGNKQMTNASLEMEEVSQIISTSVALVKELTQKTEHIGSIVSTIQEISSQTDLLALNAAIEAARAGEHGRGFAVVSEEVRKLADSSKRATKEISNILFDINLKTTEVTGIINKANEMVFATKEATKQAEQLFERITETTGLVVKQAEEVEERAQWLNNNSRTMIDEVNSISSVAEETSAAVQEVFASVEEQYSLVENVNKNFKNVEQLITNLNDLTSDKTTTD